MFSRSVVVVEDEDFLRGLLATTIEAAGFNVGTASNALDARRVIKNMDPDALVLDINLGRGQNGFDIAEATRELAPEIAIVFLTDMPDARFAGKDPKTLPKNIAYLNKTLLEDTTTLVSALEAVLTETNVKSFRHDELENRPFANLSRTQIQIIQLLAQGNTNQQIADIRQRSLAATESAIARTLDAMGVDSKAEGNARVEAVAKYWAVMNQPRNKG
jgi:DNA-binding NarL/FixJ family response regulator